MIKFMINLQMHQRDSLDRRAPIEPGIESGAKFELRSEDDDDHSMSSFRRSLSGARDSMRRRQMELDSLERRRAHDAQQKTKEEQPFSTATYTKSDPVVAEDRFFLPVQFHTVYQIT